MAQFAEDRFRLALVERHRIGPQRFGDHRELTVIFVLGVVGHIGPDMADIGGEKAGRLGDMDPGQRPGIARRIGRAVGQRATDLGMDAVDPLDRAHGIVAMAESGGGDEARGAPQPPMHVAAEVGMVEHALQRMRVEHLQQQAANAPHHHPHHIGMDQADRRIAFEQRLVAGRHRLLAAFDIVEHRAHAADQALAEFLG